MSYWIQIPNQPQQSINLMMKLHAMYVLMTYPIWRSQLLGLTETPRAASKNDHTLSSLRTNVFLANYI